MAAPGGRVPASISTSTCGHRGPRLADGSFRLSLPRNQPHFGAQEQRPVSFHVGVSAGSCLAVPGPSPNPSASGFARRPPGTGRDACPPCLPSAPGEVELPPPPPADGVGIQGLDLVAAVASFPSSLASEDASPQARALLPGASPRSQMRVANAQFPARNLVPPPSGNWGDPTVRGCRPRHPGALGTAATRSHCSPRGLIMGEKSTPRRRLCSEWASPAGSTPVATGAGPAQARCRHHPLLCRRQGREGVPGLEGGGQVPCLVGLRRTHLVLSVREALAPAHTRPPPPAPAGGGERDQLPVSPWPQPCRAQLEQNQWETGS